MKRGGEAALISDHPWVFGACRDATHEARKSDDSPDVVDLPTYPRFRRNAIEAGLARQNLRFAGAGSRL
jgi:hypothetical protein